MYRGHICKPEMLWIRIPPIVPPSSQSCLRGDDRRHSVNSIVLEGEATSTCSTKAKLIRPPGKHFVQGPRETDKAEQSKTGNTSGDATPRQMDDGCYVELHIQETTEIYKSRVQRATGHTINSAHFIYPLPPICRHLTCTMLP